ncbi:MAG TPA: hypothetical protein VHB21_05210 [Minicystis sp.]|nr:hypothetical protein [Minicystis sp.]
MASALALGGCLAESEVGAGDPDEGVGQAASAVTSEGGRGYLPAKGSFTCDFGLVGDYPPDRIAPDIERDRMIMSDNRGLLQKHLPIALDFTSFTEEGAPNLLSGGRYLFKSYEDAKNYHEFVAEDYVLDGVQFLSRPVFFNAECYDFKVVGAYEFKEIDTSQVLVRTERFALPSPVGSSIGALYHAWPEILAEAGDADMASVTLSYNADEALVSLVYTIDRIVPYDPTTPDFASLGYLQSLTPLGHVLADAGMGRTFDRSEWVFTIWHPFVAGDHGVPADWPQSPPFALPSCGDGVCEVSRGETNASCPSDCTPRCGDGRCETEDGESNVSCSGDCDQNNQDHHPEHEGGGRDHGGGCGHASP